MFLFMPQDVRGVLSKFYSGYRCDSLDQILKSKMSVMNECPQEVDKQQQGPEINGGRKYGIQYMPHTILMKRR